KKLIYPDYLLQSTSNRLEYMYINKELYTNKIPRYEQWRVLPILFSKGGLEGPYCFSHFQYFRKLIMNVALCLGGNKVYYLDDQCSHLDGVGEGREWDFTWQEFEEYVFNKTSPS